MQRRPPSCTIAAGPSTLADAAGRGQPRLTAPAVGAEAALDMRLTFAGSRKPRWTAISAMAAPGSAAGFARALSRRLVRIASATPAPPPWKDAAAWREQPIMAGAHASAPGGGEWCRLGRAGCMLKAFERDGRCIILFSKRCNAS
ncbi:hypothetical protein [Phreatobacter sp. AB_2022a]|uniref:hypothetical protein n=1 Tax=Phreatobacter sp. AB_2022a TaxID=3003134 RepID=UPI00228744CF|nr:hypothetical protein [Phreatobacter sp. AB_2022a]MCZ0736914.1 hypothetical protein [Phreatobacter sp. AB_2022a]